MSGSENVQLVVRNDTDIAIDLSPSASLRVAIVCGVNLPTTKSIALRH